MSIRLYAALTAVIISLPLPAAIAQTTDQQATVARSLELTPTGPWPTNDQAGMGNTQGPGTWMRCAAHLSAPGAKSYELSHERSNDMPQSPFGAPLVYEYRPTVGIPGTRHAFNGEHINSGEPGAQGTQMDALGHFGQFEQPWTGEGDFPADQAIYYGGLPQSDVKPTPGSPLLKLGIDQAPPIVTSAVLLDAAGHMNGGEPLEPGALITAADIDGMLQAQGLGWRGVLPGDVVLIHTGWGTLWDEDSSRYYTMGPGLAQDGAEMLAEKKVVLVALDNPFTDPVAEGQLQGKALPPQGMEDGLPFVIHHLNLAVNGIHNIQNARLAEIVADQVWTSCAMILPLRSKGASGSPVRAVAIGAPTD
ncbi:MAG: cyclase family protein [Pseudomonadota bacterium]